MEKPKILILVFLGCISLMQAQKSTLQKDKNAITAVMKAQEKAWSEQDLEGFMKGYWEDDSLKFYSSRGVTFGYRNILEDYKKRYPGKAHTGTLKFTIHDISKINSGAFFVLGEYHLTREAGDASGVFMVIFKKIAGNWKIIADMSC